jgi:hypothetical protein
MEREPVVVWWGGVGSATRPLLLPLFVCARPYLELLSIALGTSEVRITATRKMVGLRLRHQLTISILGILSFGSRTQLFFSSSQGRLVSLPLLLRR